MDKLQWNKIESELKECSPITSMQDKGSFWQEFNSRVVDIKQDISTETPFRLRWITPGLMKVAACVAFISAVLFFAVPKDKDIAVGRNKIKSLEVFASYNAMIILDDNESKGTIVWITDLTGN